MWFLYFNNADKNNLIPTFHKEYFLSFLVLFGVEVFIALYISDKFVRPYAGDFLVVILIYCFLKSFLKISDFKTAVLVFAFACFIEVLQAFNFVKLIKMENNKVASVVLGNHFEWADILLYFLGITAVLLAEKLRK